MCLWVLGGENIGEYSPEEGIVWVGNLEYLINIVHVPTGAGIEQSI